ncbi:hypothetical protein [Intrasporangium mesophilum]
MGRRLRTRLSAVALVIYAVVALVYTLARPAYWVGEWGWTVNWATGLVILLGPAVAGVAAMETARWRGAERTFVATGELPRHLVATWLTVLAPAVLVFCVHALVLLAVSATRAPTDLLQPWFALLGVGQLAVVAGVGMLLGRLFRPWVAVPLAVPTMYAVEILPKPPAVPDVLVPGASTGSIAGLVVSPAALFAQLALQLMLAVTLVALCVMLPRRGSGRSLSAPAAAAACAGVVGAVLAARACHAFGALEDPYVARPTWSCAGTAPRVCLLDGNTAYLAEWASAMHVASRSPGVSGLSLPSEFRQLPGRDDAKFAGFGVVVGEGGLINVTPPRLSDVAQSLSTPANCADYYSDGSTNTGAVVRYWMSTWIANRIQPSTDLALGDPKLARWVASTSTDEQDRFARDVYSRMKACTADDSFAATLPTSAR